MSQFGSLLVVLPHSSQLLGDDQLGNVHSVAEQVRDGLLGKLQGCFRTPAIKKHSTILVSESQHHIQCLTCNVNNKMFVKSLLQYVMFHQ